MPDTNEAVTQLADTLIATLPKTFAPDIEVTIESIKPGTASILDGAETPVVDICFRIAATGLADLEGQPVLRGQIGMTPAALGDVDPADAIQRIIAERAALEVLAAAEDGSRGDGLANNDDKAEVATNVKLWISELIAEANGRGWDAATILEKFDDLADEVVDTYP